MTSILNKQMPPYEAGSPKGTVYDKPYGFPNATQHMVVHSDVRAREFI